MTDISLYAPTQQTHVVRLPKGRDPDKTGIFPPQWGGGERGRYYISDMILVALPPCVAGDGLKDPSSYSLYLYSTVHMYLIWLV